MRRRIEWLVLAGMCAAACASDGTHFETRFAQGVAPEGIGRVSLVGVYRDGRMSEGSWENLGPTLAPSFGNAQCDLAYGPALLAEKPTFAAAIDDQTRANGVTDELLGLLAPMAEGDALVVVQLNGRPPSAKDGAEHTKAAAASAGPSLGGGRGGRRRGGAPHGPERSPAARNVFDMSASVYSKRLQRSVAALNMSYTGESEDDALRRFADKLRAVFPGARCVGWNLAAPVDEQRIRALEP